jgi:hypothetical protein
MAFAAAGMEFLRDPKSSPSSRFLELWPKTAVKYVLVPCKCNLDRWGIQGVIQHLFDHHVYREFGTKSVWTLDQLIDWVRSVEEDDGPMPVEARTGAAAEEPSLAENARADVPCGTTGG